MVTFLLYHTAKGNDALRPRLGSSERLRHSMTQDAVAKYYAVRTWSREGAPDVR